ncbi:MAG: SDR family NAD(P)-dependent oxidoreductase [Acidimicrobiales bacterium]|nr:SDR family NAD(P)-dependent oxidoreductase [Acidimicrobiales bacterium]
MTRLTTGDRSVRGRVVVVTGAASGMGRATAHLFGDEGALVAVLDVAESGVAAVVDEIVGSGGTAAGYVVDVTDDDAVRSVVARIAGDLGPPDILVNNAGVSIPAPIDGDGFDEQWARTIAVNLTAHTSMIRACLPHLRRNGDGRIVNVASTEGIGGSAYISPYTASKHGVIGLSRSLAVELGPSGVTVNVVCPGPIHTGMTEGIPDEAKEKFARRNVPMRRYGQPEEVAHATLSLALPAMSYCTGAVVVVDGGFTTKNN